MPISVSFKVIVPVIITVRADKAKIGCVYQGRGLERLARFLLGKPGGGEPAQLFIDQRLKLLCGGRFAVFDLGKGLRNVRHDASDYSPCAVE